MPHRRTWQPRDTSSTALPPLFPTSRSWERRVYQVTCPFVPAPRLTLLSPSRCAPQPLRTAAPMIPLGGVHPQRPISSSLYLGRQENHLLLPPPLLPLSGRTESLSSRTAARDIGFGRGFPSASNVCPPLAGRHCCTGRAPECPDQRHVRVGGPPGRDAGDGRHMFPSDRTASPCRPYLLSPSHFASSRPRNRWRKTPLGVPFPLRHLVHLPDNNPDSSGVCGWELPPSDRPHRCVCEGAPAGRRHPSAIRGHR